MSNTAENLQKEPLLRVVKRAELPTGKIILLRLLAVLLSLIAGGIFIACVGQNPFVIYKTILSGACRSVMAFQGTIKLMIPLLITSLGVTLAFKMKFWNIGAEGQIIFGATCATFFALFFSGLNHVLLIHLNAQFHSASYCFLFKRRSMDGSRITGLSKDCQI